MPARSACPSSACSWSSRSRRPSSTHLVSEAQAWAYRIGPLVDERQREQVHRHVTDAVKSGATALVGGEMPDGAACVYPPTVLADCTSDILVMREETFGPVVPVRVVLDFDAALTEAAADEYGLAATVLTSDMAHAQQAWRNLPVGTVKINAVFGGAPGGASEPRRASGNGYGFGPELLDEMTVMKGAAQVAAALTRIADQFLIRFSKQGDRGSDPRSGRTTS